MQTAKDAKKLIYRHWKHAHEEDQGNHLVFRPASGEFPPSRGRVEFNLDETDRCTFMDIASGNGLEGIECHLSWDPDIARIIVDYPGGRQRVFELVSLETDKLVLKEIY